MSDYARLAAELVACPLLLIDADGKVVWVNADAEEWLGRSRQAMHRAGLVTALPFGPALAELANQAIVENSDIIAVAKVMPDGSVFDLHAKWSEIDALVALSAFPRASATPLASQDAALGFGRMLAHELKNPLASVRGAAQLIRRQSEDNDEVAELSGMIIEDVDRVTRLANHWSGVGDIAIGEKAAINLNRLSVAAMESLVRGNPEAEGLLHDEFDPSLPHGSGDSDLLHQAILNLLQNACDALGDQRDGRIELRTAFEGGPRARTATGVAPLVISVIDNGPGVPETLGSGIFTPFVTTKPAGEGLGLAFTARIAALHDGQLDYQSEPGRTVFNIRLPVAEETSA